MTVILHRPEHFKENKSGLEQLVSLRTRPDGAMLSSANIDTSKRRWYLTTDESQTLPLSGEDVLYDPSQNPSPWTDIPQEILDDVKDALESLRDIYVDVAKPRRNQKQSFTDDDWETVLTKKEREVADSLKRELNDSIQLTKWSAQLDHIALVPLDEQDGERFGRHYSLRMNLSLGDHRGTISRQFLMRFGKTYLPYETDVWGMSFHDSLHPLLIGF